MIRFKQIFSRHGFTPFFMPAYILLIFCGTEQFDDWLIVPLVSTVSKTLAHSLPVKTLGCVAFMLLAIVPQAYLDGRFRDDEWTTENVPRVLKILFFLHRKAFLAGRERRKGLRSTKRVQ